MSSCSILHQKSLIQVHSDTILIKRDNNSFLYNHFPSHFFLLGKQCNFHLIPLITVKRPKIFEGNGFIAMLPSKEFDSNLRRMDNNADSLMLFSPTSGTLKKQLCQIENESHVADFYQSLDIISSAGLIIFFIFSFAPLKHVNESCRHIVALIENRFLSFYRCSFIHI